MLQPLSVIDILVVLQIALALASHYYCSTLVVRKVKKLIALLVVVTLVYRKYCFPDVVRLET
jgi:hypothetical protein